MAGIHYRVKESVPQDVEGNSNALTIALHAFFLDLAESRGAPRSGGHNCERLTIALPAFS